MPPPCSWVSILVVVDWSRQHERRSRSWPLSRGFNPCCGGLVASTLHPWLITMGFRWFQSLLWWIGRVNSDPARTASPRGRVSILVVVDWSRQPDPDARRHLLGRGVSILVVVDWSRQRRRWAARRHRGPGFNPCCGGLVASTSRLRVGVVTGATFQSLLWWIGRVNIGSCRSSIARRIVSILVVVDWSRQLESGIGVNGGYVPFQSLLWWIGRVNRRPRGQGSREVGVSILVVVDWSRQHVAEGLGHQLLDRFQSLLWWIGRVNPRSPTLSPSIATFQSLLWWIGRVNALPGPKRSSAHAQFQSLLWWIGRVNVSVTGQIIPCGSCFNPCCGGLVASTGAVAFEGDPMSNHVSILVVVDWSRQRVDLAAINGTGQRFQSLLWWIGRVNVPGPGLGRTGDPRFNPCCGGLVASTGIPRHQCVDPLGVSILVVVDWSRQLGQAGGCPLRGPVSILVVVDWSRQPARLDRDGIAEQLFQSLLWWIGRVNDPVLTAW